MGKREVTEKDLKAVLRFERFCQVQGGIYPASIAAIKLGLTTSGVFQASERGWISFFKIGRDRWYSRRDVLRYREQLSMQKNLIHFRASEPKDCTDDEDGGKWRGTLFVDM